jgi:hypothetical protein
MQMDERGIAEYSVDVPDSIGVLILALRHKRWQMSADCFAGNRAGLRGVRQAPQIE